MKLILSKLFLCCLCVHLAVTEQNPRKEDSEVASPFFQIGDLDAASPDGQPKFFFWPFMNRPATTPRPFIIIPAPAPAPMPAPAPAPAPALSPLIITVTPSPPSGSCTSTLQTVAVNGECSSSCRSGLTLAGTCTSGTTTGVCCVSFNNNCAQSSSERESYFVNNNYPRPYNTNPAVPCSYTVTRNSSNVCLVRIDYTSASTANTNNGNPPACTQGRDDVITNSAVNNNVVQPLGNTICTPQINTYTYAEFPATNSIVMTVTPGTPNGAPNPNLFWNIKVTQIPNSCQISGR